MTGLMDRRGGAEGVGAARREAVRQRFAATGDVPAASPPERPGGPLTVRYPAAGASTATTVPWLR
jgi:hypothetical protein